MQFSDTIFALSSGRTPSGVAVVRVSGIHSRQVIESLTGGVPEARRAVMRSLKASDGTLLDRCLVIFFEGPATFTGEDCSEFHLHGGSAVVASVLNAIDAIAGVRAAEAGEFTRRAFLNGKVDLVEAEALADLIAAETVAQQRFALESAGGAQAGLYGSWRSRIVHALAMTEAELDFSDEGDVPGSVGDTVWADMVRLVAEIREHIGQFHRAEMIRDGYRVVIVGEPNAGKSSLLNAFARREVAIVTDEPGTTRDLIDVSLDLGGLKVVVTDTAGLRDNPGAIEAIGIDRALKRSEESDLVIRLVPAGAERAEFEGPRPRTDLVVMSKADLIEGGRMDGSGLSISTKTGQGIQELLLEIDRRARIAVNSSGGLLPARARHVAHLGDAASHLDGAISSPGEWLEVRAEELRRAAHSFGLIAGSIGVEDVLDAVFSEFCIGK